MFLACHSAFSSNSTLSNTPIGKWIDHNTFTAAGLQTSLLVSAVCLTIIGAFMLGAAFAGGSFFGLAGAPLLFNAQIILLTGTTAFALFGTIELVVSCIHRYQLEVAFPNIA